MSSKLHKLDKNLNIISQVDIPMGLSEAMTISHFTDVEVSASQDLPFTFKSFPKNIPILEDEEFIVVIREKVNLSDNMPTEIRTKNNGLVEGKSNYIKTFPYSHPNGVAAFKQLKGDQ